MKEKEAARREYRQAVERGHGAYLMDQDAPVRTPSTRQRLANRFLFWSWLCFVSPQDVFTISVGNLPPAASVLIKVTFVSELMVKDGSVLFSLPGSVAPWQESAALNQTTQVRDGRWNVLSLDRKSHWVTHPISFPWFWIHFLNVSRRFYVFSIRRQVTMEKVCVADDAAGSR